MRWLGELVWELLHGCSVTTVEEEVRLEYVWLSSPLKLIGGEVTVSLLRKLQNWEIDRCLVKKSAS